MTTPDPSHYPQDGLHLTHDEVEEFDAEFAEKVAAAEGDDTVMGAHREAARAILGL